MVPQPQKPVQVKPGQHKPQGKKNQPSAGADKKPMWFSIAILSLTFLAFFPSLKNDFLPTWDDNVYVTQNPIIRELG